MKKIAGKMRKKSVRRSSNSSNTHKFIIFAVFLSVLLIVTLVSQRQQTNLPTETTYSKYQLLGASTKKKNNKNNRKPNRNPTRRPNPTRIPTPTIMPGANFETDTTPVDMREYWPTYNHTVVNRRPNGSLYNKRVTKSVDPARKLIPSPKAGEVIFGRDDYYPLPADAAKAVPGGDPANDPIAYYNNSWTMIKRPDMSVSEIIDSFPLQANCRIYCTSRANVYPPSGDIVHGRPGGHTLGESYYYKMNVKMRTTQNIETKPLKDVEWKLYSIIRMEQKYNFYTPEYGRRNNVWGKGNGKTFARTVKQILQHGAIGPKDPPGGKVCPNEPAGFAHVPGYTSFWVYTWYAPNIGPVKEHLLWDERTCTGSATLPAGSDVSGYDLMFLDYNWNG